MNFFWAFGELLKGNKVKSKTFGCGALRMAVKKEWGADIETIVDKNNDEVNITRGMFLDDWEIVDD